MGRRILFTVVGVCGGTAGFIAWLLHGAQKRYVRGMWYE